MVTTLSDINPFANMSSGSLSSVTLIILVVVMAVVVFIFIGAFIFYFTAKKQYWIKIHVFKIVGNSPTRVSTFRAREVAFGRAGDKLWRVAPKGFAMVFKVLKWLPVGKHQTANNEFWYWIREDGEWINFTISDIDKISKEAKVQFVQEDMRLQRLATERILEQRLLQKTFWEKYGGLVMNMMYFMVIAIALTIMFFQYGKLVDKIGGLLSMAQQIYETTQPQSLIPVG